VGEVIYLSRFLQDASTRL